ncbi:hypothetical protein [Streptomyces lydicus]
MAANLETGLLRAEHYVAAPARGGSAGIARDLDAVIAGLILN